MWYNNNSSESFFVFFSTFFLVIATICNSSKVFLSFAFLFYSPMPLPFLYLEILPYYIEINLKFIKYIIIQDCRHVRACIIIFIIYIRGEYKVNIKIQHWMVQILQTEKLLHFIVEQRKAIWPTQHWISLCVCVYIHTLLMTLKMIPAIQI